VICRGCASDAGKGRSEDNGYANGKMCTTQRNLRRGGKFKPAREILQEEDKKANVSLHKEERTKTKKLVKRNLQKRGLEQGTCSRDEFLERSRKAKEVEIRRGGI